MDPNLIFQLATVELKAEATKALTWQRLFSKGKRALTPAAHKTLTDVVDRNAAHRIFDAVFIFVGGVLVEPKPKHLEIPDVDKDVFKDILVLPEVYTVSYFLLNAVISTTN